MKYWLPPLFDSTGNGPTWRNFGFPAIALGTLWFVGWKWSKTSDNQLDWNNFKLHASEQARRSLGMEDYIHTVGADSEAKSQKIVPVVPGPNPQTKVVQKAQSSQQPATSKSERFLD